LATLLSVRLPLAARIVRRFRSRNDDYVVERVLAAAFMVQHVSEGVPELAAAVHEAASRYLAFSCRLPRARFDRRLTFSERLAADALDADVDVDALCVRFW
jgi:hypothetical protein